MNLRHLEIFQCVCEHMSISKAAEELYMSQPAVSIAIKELEDYYKTRLFDRMSRKIYLTKSGEKLLSYTNTILSQLELSVDEIRNKTYSEECHIGVNVTIGEAYLSGILSHLKRELPTIKHYVNIENVRSIEKDLLNNKFDFVITDSPQSSSNLILKKLHGEKMVAVCSYDFEVKESLSSKELCNYPLLRREVGSGIRNAFDYYLSDKTCFVKESVESVSNLSLIELAIHGHGITMMPYSLVKNDVKNGRLKIIDIEDCHIKREYYLVYHKEKYIGGGIQSCMDSVIHYFSEIYDIEKIK